MTVIGIDFGTTTCSVARWSGEESQKPTLLVINNDPRSDQYIIKTKVQLEDGKDLRNFKLATDKSGRGEVFLRRRQLAAIDIEFTFDQMGQSLVPLNNDMEYILEVKREPIPKGGGGEFQEEDLVIALEKLFAQLYKKLKNEVAANEIVVGLPLGYADLGRERIINSLIKAGWAKEKSQIVLFPEPLAVALQCGLDYKKTGEQRILVADHGGGTLDMCVFDLTAKNTNKEKKGDFHIKVLAQNRCDIAGNKFDEALLAWIGDKDSELIKGYGVETTSEINDYPLWEAVEECKIKLSSEETYNFKYPCQHRELKMTITRSNLENALKPAIDDIGKEIETLLKASDIDANSIDKVYLAGGSAKMPAIKKLFEKYFTKDKIHSQYTGTGQLAKSLSQVPKYKDLLERLCESTYGVWDYEKKEVIPVAEAGMLVTPTTELIQVPRKEIDIKKDGRPAPLIIFNQQGGEWNPLYQLEMEPKSVGPITIIPMLDNDTGIIKIKLIQGNLPTTHAIRNYSEMKDYAPPVVFNGQIARIYNSPPNYFIESIRNIATGHADIKMAAGRMRPYSFKLNQYKIIGHFDNRFDNNHDLCILRASRLSGFAPVNLEDLVYRSSFVPLLDIEGNEFSIKIPKVEQNEDRNIEIEKNTEQADAINCENEAAAVLEVVESEKSTTKNSLDESKIILADFIGEEIDKAFEQGKKEMKRELIKKYVTIKTKKSKIEPKTLLKLIDEWEDQELDQRIEQVFRSSSTADLMGLLMKKAKSATTNESNRKGLINRLIGKKN